jgi:hypothetical protein
MPRISFSKQDAAHIYEWLVMYWAHAPVVDEWPRVFGGCYTCQQLGKRLERLIGKAEVRRIKRVVRLHR